MATIDKSIIKEIAEDLNCGCTCYYNFKTKEVIAIPNFLDGFDDFDDDEFKAPTEEDFTEIRPLESSESFKIMELFTQQLPENTLKQELERALRNSKPFQNFKYLVETSEFRAPWFSFKQTETEKHVAFQLNEK
ncbi:hypothetical protein [Algibacter sp. L4_22]|uniref:hypothetical protein n=1 Tax=Algibacter sp. L4_22 TaxID=2942477 RepID=UPI00201B6108|nr:hypothetical protein [Algibacter sp. L4_22]MCL5129841.1 hypothetical protein [Algibacter sp. L4_22]